LDAALAWGAVGRGALYVGTLPADMTARVVGVERDDRGNEWASVRWNKDDASELRPVTGGYVRMTAITCS
jgi:hypothetical protein